MKYWEIIVNKITKAGFSVGWVSALDDYGRTVWIGDGHLDGKRFIMRADETIYKPLKRLPNSLGLNYKRPGDGYRRVTQENA